MKTMVLVLMVVAAVLTIGCGEDDLLPSPPVSGGVSVTLDNAWPSEDNRYWEYSSRERVWFSGLVDSNYVFTDSTDVPAAPGLGTIVAWLNDPVVPTPGSVTQSQFRLRFDGERLTAFGRTTQNLLEEWAPFVDPLAPFESRFQTQLAFFRSGFQNPQGVFRVADHVTLDPVFLHGGAWEKSALVIGTYGDLDPGLVWKFLDGNLEPGDSFSVQIFSNTTLRGWVRERTSIQTDVGEFENVLDVVYLLDTGVSGSTTIFQPDPVGFYRLVFFGRVFYVPTVGPVFAYERHAVTAGDPGGEGWGDITLSLIGIRAGDR